AAKIMRERNDLLRATRRRSGRGSGRTGRRLLLVVDRREDLAQPLALLHQVDGGARQVRAARAVGILLDAAGDLAHAAAALAVALVERLHDGQLLRRRQVRQADGGDRREVGRLRPALRELALGLVTLRRHLRARGRLARDGGALAASAAVVATDFPADQK